MSDEIDLLYDPKSFAGPFSEKEVGELEEYLEGRACKIVFQVSYLEHLKRFHGGIPRKRYFITNKGTDCSISRVLNFLDTDSENQLGIYNVSVTWSMINDRLGETLMPFAELFAGDHLCFDYTNGPDPEIVVWFHELSTEDEVYSEFVSPSFDEFLKILSEYSG